MKDVNPWETTPLPVELVVNGQKVEIFGPNFARITIFHPFQMHIGEEPSLDMQTFVMNRTQGVIQYLLNEQFMDNSKGQAGFQVVTQYQPV